MLDIQKLENDLQSDCSACCGLCCSALYFAKIDGFPEDKVAGKACLHLRCDYQCNIHHQLMKKGYHGCIGYDCMGAGQKLTQLMNPNKIHIEPMQKLMMQYYPLVYELQQIVGYLVEAYHLPYAKAYTNQLESFLYQHEQFYEQGVEHLSQPAIDRYRSDVNEVLKAICKNVQEVLTPSFTAKQMLLGKHFKKADLSGVDFSMRICIGADFRGCRLSHTNFLGCDVRDAHVEHTDLRDCLFLTQRQVNVMKGNASTQLAKHLKKPNHWL